MPDNFRTPDRSQRQAPTTSYMHAARENEVWNYTLVSCFDSSRRAYAFSHAWASAHRKVPQCPKRCVADPAVVQNIWENLSLAADGTITVQTCLNFFIPRESVQDSLLRLGPGYFKTRRSGFRICSKFSCIPVFRGRSTRSTRHFDSLATRSSCSVRVCIGSTRARVKLRLQEPPKHVLTADLSVPYALDAIRAVVRLRCHIPRGWHLSKKK